MSHTYGLPKSRREKACALPCLSSPVEANLWNFALQEWRFRIVPSGKPAKPETLQLLH